MDSKEVEAMETLKHEMSGTPTKNTAKQAQKVYNKYNDEEITDCMCSRIRRKILGKLMIDWFERQDR